MLKRALIFVVAACVLIGLLFYSQVNREPLKVSGFIEADEIRIGSRVGGRVAAVHVEEGDSVNPGQKLIDLDPFDLRERRAEAEALVAARQAEFDKLKAGFRPQEVAQAKARVDQLAARLAALEAGPRAQEIAAGKANLDNAKANLDLAQITFNRVKALFDRNAISKEEFDTASAKLAIAQANVEVAAQQLSGLEEGTRKEDIAGAKAQLEEAVQAWELMKAGYRDEEVATAQASLDAAKAALAAIDKTLGELTITTPVPGVVEALELQPGDLVNANAPVLSLMDVSRLWVRAYVPENRLNIQIGDKVNINVDSYPGQMFGGRVSFISRHGEFTPSNIQTPEERSKQVFRIKVILDEGTDVLRPGMAADVWLKPR